MQGILSGGEAADLTISANNIEKTIVAVELGDSGVLA